MDIRNKGGVHTSRLAAVAIPSLHPRDWSCNCRMYVGLFVDGILA